MKLKLVEKYLVWVFETDRDFPIVRRNGPGDWENLMGESWEPIDGEWLESEFNRRIDDETQGCV